MREKNKGSPGTGLALVPRWRFGGVGFPALPGAQLRAGMLEELGVCWGRSRRLQGITTIELAPAALSSALEHNQGSSG